MKVSVLMVTYNHAPFIRQAIHSVLTQEAGFEYELVIGDDCSTDGTGDIVRELAGEHPGRIRVFRRTQNLGMHRNFVATLQACRGRYVALLDGDDYWTSPHKLARQADFLDRHPDYALCCHDVEEFYQDGSRPSWVHSAPNGRETFGLEDLLHGNFVSSCSVMFRKGVVQELPEWFYNTLAPDWAFHVLNAQHGKIGYLKGTMAAYRVHPGGVVSSRGLADRIEHVVKVYEHLNAHLGFRHEALIRRQIVRRWYALVAGLAESGDVRGARRYAARCLREGPWRGNLAMKARAILRACAPRAWKTARGLYSRWIDRGSPAP